MSEVVWIVSYPKSGNTSLRFLIAHLLHDRLPSSAELLRLIPDAHRTREWPARRPQRGCS